MIDCEKLRALRESAGMSQVELAKAVGVTPQYISRAERGEKGLSLSVAAAVARTLGCKIDDFVKFVKEAI